MITSQEIVDKYKVSEKGQLTLFSDPDELLVKTKFQKTDDPEFDKLAIVHWWMNVYVPDGYGRYKTEYEIYSTWSNAIGNNFKYISQSGYNLQTRQSCVQIRAYKNEPTADLLAELELWLPHIKECDGIKHIGIFESSLSEHGIYAFEIRKDKFVITFTRYHNKRDLKEFDNLSDAVNCIRESIYYKKNIKGDDYEEGEEEDDY